MPQRQGSAEFSGKHGQLLQKISIYETKFIKSQLSCLLVPHIHTVTNFPQAHSIMQWIIQSEPKDDNIYIIEFSELLEMFKKHRMTLWK